MRKMRKIVAAVLTGVMVLSMAACGKTDNKPTPSATPSQGAETTPETTKPADDPKKETTLVWGTHWVNGLDPHVVDEITGEPVMAAEQRTARLAAEKAVLEQLGVKFEYVQMATEKDVLTSEMAGRPICDIATVWGGCESTLLKQNVVQNLDAYEHLFRENEEMGWMLYDKLYGHYYMMGDVCRFMQRWPLVYNIDMIKEAGVENPNVLFEKGEWTWSKFKELLTQLKAAYADNDTIDVYNTDFRMATLSAAYSNGAYIYGAAGVGAADQKMVDAVDFMQGLINDGLLTFQIASWNELQPDWLNNCNRFNGSTTVFTDCADWVLGQGNQNGDAVGIVPWPRPDRLAIDSPEYRQCMTVSDSLCILKGVSEEKTELAIKALMLYTKTYYCTLGGVDTYAQYQDKQGESVAADYKLDITNATEVDKDGTTLGDLILSAYNYITKAVAVGSDVSDLMGLRVTWDDAVGTAFTQKTSYKTYIDENIGKFNQVLKEMEDINNKGGFNDTVKPVVEFIKEPIVVPVGTKLTDAIWADFIKCTDVGDGDIAVSEMKPEFNEGFTEDIFKTAGYYNRAFKARFYDKAGNFDHKTVSVYVYNPDNKVAPTYTLVENPAAIKKDTEVEKIAWAGAFIATAEDADGLDVSANVKADLSTIDTTTAGEYNVKLTIADFAGNTTEVTVKVTVVAE